MPWRAPPGQTLQATALVHEAYLALVGGQDPGWSGRGHFFGAAAQAMREIVIDQARRKAAVKRGGGLQREAVEVDGLDGKAIHLLAWDEACPVGTARLLVKGATGKIGRVCVLPEAVWPTRRRRSS